MAVLKSLYEYHAGQYEELVAHEDYLHRLLPAIGRLHPLRGANVVEFGAGTGRVTGLLAPLARRILAVDASLGMVQVACEKRRAQPHPGWHTVVADNRAIPAGTDSADLAIEGWSLAQMVAWERDAWRDVVQQVLGEMARVVRPKGTIILIETLGTGKAKPQPPADWFHTLYRCFEQEHGFSHKWLRTDLRFDSLEQAQALMGFFFGEETAQAVMREAFPYAAGGVIVPECTGLWWRTV
jgi:ubiquinone/menaquinone biosynthesis C-methylase UbiE